MRLWVLFFALFMVTEAPAVPFSPVYCPLLFRIGDLPTQFRLTQKSNWRMMDLNLNAPPERRVKMRTNIDRRAGQLGGMDESADPAAPFKFGKKEVRPEGMPAGAYWTNSGKYFFRSDSVTSGLHGGGSATETFEFVFMHETPDGKIVHQSGGYAAPDSSWGWDGRFELQPVGAGKYELVITQGSMEQPRKMRGGAQSAQELPEVSKNNASRSRHLFKPIKFEEGKLYVLDQGPILGNVPDINGDWISFEPVVGKSGETTNRLTHAHGYGENYFPVAGDPRKIATDEYGYPVRVFDMVTAEVHIERIVNGEKVIKKEPATTRSIAYRMDPKNPSRRVPPGTLLPNGKPADEGIVIMAEDLPEAPGTPLKSTRRMMNLADGKLLEVRKVDMDGTVRIAKNVDGLPAEERLPSTLVEGFNPVPGVVTLPSGKKYYLGTFSASEYTAGALAKDGKKDFRYGTYIGFRPAEDGFLGRYRPVTAMTDQGLDFADALEDFTELYGLGWGAGRPQAYQDEAGKWWMDVHFTDNDLIGEGLPTSGFPARHEDFADAYRRHKATLPIRWTEKNGQPWFEIDDPAVESALKKFRARKAAKAARPG